jgi:hypothetical protein
MTNTTNTNSARKFRATVALMLLGVAGFISLILISDAIRYGEDISAYLGGAALWQALGAIAIAVVLFAWNGATYDQPRYARSRG